MRVPRNEQELALRAERAAQRLTAELGRYPSPAQVAVSLDAPRGESADQGELLADVIGRADEGYGRAEQRALLQRPLQALAARDREVILLRFWEDLTQQQIAERIGVTQMQVSRIIQRLITCLRESAQHAGPRGLAPRRGHG